MPALLHQVLAFATLREAWLRVRDNRGCAGGDGETLDQFEINLDSNLAALRNEVLKSTYEPRPLLSLVVEVPGKKPRQLAVPAVRDRVLQTAAGLVLTPLFEAEFEDCSFAYRRGRSVDQAVRRIMQYRDQGFRWVVDADIASFFAEIDQERLVREVAELVQDVRIIDLIKLWLTAPSPMCSKPTMSRSAWMARAAGSTMSSWNGFGEALRECLSERLRRHSRGHGWTSFLLQVLQPNKTSSKP